jgi:hypothetical protein
VDVGRNSVCLCVWYGRCRSQSAVGYSGCRTWTLGGVFSVFFFFYASTIPSFSPLLHHSKAPGLNPCPPLRLLRVSHSTSTSSSLARVARKRRTDALGLDAAEALELLGLHRDLRAEAHLARRALDERHTVRVQGLVDRRRAGLGARDGDAVRGFVCSLGLVPLAERLDDGGLHRELDPVERDEPYDVLHIKR